jgi:hypothetical protein
LDSICPTGAGKVAGVKIEIDDEKLAGEGRRLLELFIGLKADELALALPFPTWNVASQRRTSQAPWRGFLWRAAQGGN